MNFGEAFGVYSPLNTHDEAHYNQRGDYRGYNEMEDLGRTSGNQKTGGYGASKMTMG
jgi:hypothetical protein